MVAWNDSNMGLGENHQVFVGACGITAPLLQPILTPETGPVRPGGEGSTRRVLHHPLPSVLEAIRELYRCMTDSVWQSYLPHMLSESALCQDQDFGTVCL